MTCQCRNLGFFPFNFCCVSLTSTCIIFKIAKKITKSNGNSQLHGTAFSGQPLVDTYIMYLLDGVEEDNYN